MNDGGELVVIICGLLFVLFALLLKLACVAAFIYLAYAGGTYLLGL